MVWVCNNYPQLIKHAEQSTINVGISLFRFAHGGAQQPTVLSPSNPHDYLTLMIMFASMFMIIAKRYCKRVLQKVSCNRYCNRRLGRDLNPGSLA